MSLFCVDVREDSVSLLSFPFCSYDKVLSCEISFACRLKYQFSCFSSHFCFLLIVVLMILVLLVFFLVSVINLFFFGSFYMVSNHCISILTLSLVQLIPFPPSFPITYGLLLASLGYNTWCIFITFLDLLSISWNCSLVHFKIGLEYFTR